MHGYPRIQVFRLREGGVVCDARGLFVDSVALLRAAPDARIGRRWSVRARDEINRKLSARYGLPVDVSGKMDGLASVARALDDGNLALAGIGALLLKFPEPPSMEKGATSDEAVFALTEALSESGLLKGNWDPDKHPRTGEAPNPGWFAPVGEELAPKAEVRPTRFGWPSRAVGQALRKLVKDLGKKAVQGIAVLLSDGTALLAEILYDLGPTELNGGEQRLIDQFYANFDPPKTLEDLRIKPTRYQLGYEQHHIVEQNPSNVEKRVIVKFGRERLDDADNLVWAPRLKHEKITAYYNARDSDDPHRRRRRDVYNELSFDAQRAIGLLKLREEGVLK